VCRDGNGEHPRDRRAGSGQRGIFEDHAAEEAAGSDPRQWRRHPRFLRHRRVPRRIAGGGKLIPASGPDRWKVKSDHSLLQGMLDSMLLCRYEGMVRPEPLRWKAWSDDHWNRAWTGMARFENKPDVLSGPFNIAQIGLVCVLGYADFRFASCGWRKAYPKLDKLTRKCWSGRR